VVGVPPGLPTSNLHRLGHQPADPDRGDRLRRGGQAGAAPQPQQLVTVEAVGAVVEVLDHPLDLAYLADFGALLDLSTLRSHWSTSPSYSTTGPGAANSMVCACAWRRRAGEGEWRRQWPGLQGEGRRQGPVAAAPWTGL